MSELEKRDLERAHAALAAYAIDDPLLEMSPSTVISLLMRDLMKYCDYIDDHRPEARRVNATRLTLSTLRHYRRNP